MGMFGTLIPKFTRSGSTVELDNSNIETAWQLPDTIVHKSVITGRKNYINLGDYSSFNVTVELHKYVDSGSKFTEIYEYNHTDVYFYPHKDGLAVKNSSDEDVPFQITGMQLNYLNNIDFPEQLTISFESMEYTDVSHSMAI